MRGLKNSLAEWATMLLFWLIAFGAVLWLLVGSVAYWVKRGWLPADTAGWAQALGGVLAVAVAIAVPAWQKRHEIQRADQDERKRRIDSVDAVRSLTQDLMAHFEAAAFSLTNVRLIAVSYQKQNIIEGLARVSRSCIDLDLVAFGNEMVTFVLVIKSAAHYAEQAPHGSGYQSPNYEEILRQYRARITILREQEHTLLNYFDLLDKD